MKAVLAFCAIFLLPFVLTAQIVLRATKAAFIKDLTERADSANAHGVYPVKLTWTANAPCDVYRSARADGGFIRIAKSVPSGGRSKSGEYIDKNEDAAPEQVFFYKIQCGAEESGVAAGYGALTHEAYMHAYNRNIVSSHAKLTLMFKRIALQKLGKEGADGDASGTLSYHAKIRGIFGNVIIRYDNYSDSKNWVLTGNTNIKANIFANGTMYGRVECSGMYPGTVDYGGIVIRRGQAAGGSYAVTPAGFPSGAVLWDALTPEDTGVTDAEEAFSGTEKRGEYEKLFLSDGGTGLFQSTFAGDMRS